jgi:hypothetical protein
MSQKRTAENTELSNDTKTIITVLCLFLFYPLGLILTWVWMRWPKWLKVIITLPLLMAALGILLALFIGFKLMTYGFDHSNTERRVPYQMESTHSSQINDYQ